MLLASSYNTFEDIERALPVFDSKIHGRPSWNYGLYLLLGRHTDGSCLIYVGSSGALAKRFYGHWATIKADHETGHQPDQRPSIGKLLHDTQWTWQMHMFAKLTTETQREAMLAMESIAVILFQTLHHSRGPKAQEFTYRLEGLNTDETIVPPFMCSLFSSSKIRINFDLPVHGSGFTLNLRICHICGESTKIGVNTDSGFECKACTTAPARDYRESKGFKMANIPMLDYCQSCGRSTDELGGEMRRILSLENIVCKREHSNFIRKGELNPTS